MGSKGESEPTAGGATTLEVAFETELEPIVEFEDVDSTGGIRLGVWPRYSVSHSSRSSRLEKNVASNARIAALQKKATAATRRAIIRARRLVWIGKRHIEEWDPSGRKTRRVRW